MPQETVAGACRRAGRARTGSTRAVLGLAATLPHGRYGKVGIYVPDYGLYSCSRHHAAHLSVFKQAPAVTTSHSGKTQAEVHSSRTCRPAGPPPPQRCPAVSPQPLRRGTRGQPSPPKGSGGGKRRPQPLATSPQWGRKRLGPRPGRAAQGRLRGERTPRTKQRAPSSVWGQRLRPGVPHPLGHPRPSDAQPHSPGQAVTLRLSSPMRTCASGGRGAGIPPPSPPATPAPRH